MLCEPQVVEVHLIGPPGPAGPAASLVETVTYNVPSDYPTMQEAFDDLGAMLTRAGAQIVINIEAGHIIGVGEGLSLHDGDFSHFRIDATSSPVSVNPAFTGDLLLFRHCIAPTLNCQFDMGGVGLDGLHAYEGGIVFVTSLGGVINAGQHGIDLSNVVCSAIGSVWDGAAITGIRLEQVANGTFQNATANNCGQLGVFVSRGSSCNFISGFAQNAGINGAQVQRARLACGSANFSGAVNCGISAREASNIMAGGGCVLDGCGTGIEVTTGSIADVGDASIVGCATYGIRALEASRINATSTRVTGSGTKDLQVRWGGIIDASGCVTTHGTAGPALEDCERITTFNVHNGFGMVTNEAGNVGEVDWVPKTFSATLADDEATSMGFGTPSGGSFGIMTIATNVVANGCPNGVLLLRAGTGAGIGSVALERLTNITLSTGALTTGTADGVDGDFNINAHSDGRVYFKNRVGASRTIRVAILGD